MIDISPTIRICAVVAFVYERIGWSTRSVLLATLITGAAARPIFGQTSSTLMLADSSRIARLLGRVTDSAGAPIAGATITIAADAAHVTQRVESDSSGRFHIGFRMPAVSYILVVEAKHYSTERVVFTPQPRSGASAVALIPDIRLRPGGASLPRVQTFAVRVHPDNAFTVAPGSSEEVIPADIVSASLWDWSTLDQLAGLSTGVAVGGTGYSIGGAGSDQNRITLDGSPRAYSDLPRDALSSVRISTATADAARGGFAGGEIGAVSGRGYNIQRSSVRIRGLSAPEGTLGRNGLLAEGEIALSTSGALRRDKVFYFGAYQQTRSLFRDESVFSTRNGSSIGSANGIPYVSVASVTASAISAGIPLDVVSARPTRDATSAIWRMTFEPSDASSLSLRIDGARRADGSRHGSVFDSPSRGSSRTSLGYGGQLAASHLVGGQTLLEGWIALSTNVDQRAARLASVPSATVVLTANDSSPSSVLRLGGGGDEFRRERFTVASSSGQLSHISADTKHRVTAGLSTEVTYLADAGSGDSAGTFFYPSVGAFTINAPTEYSRSSSVGVRSAGTRATSTFVSDRWKVRPRVQAQLGLRLDLNNMHGSPVYDQAVDSNLHVRTDRLPSSFYLSPRASFAWKYGQRPDGLPVGEINFGAGVFRANYVPALVENVIGSTEPQNQRLVCLGDAVAPPDWARVALGDPYLCRTAPSIPVESEPSRSLFSRDFSPALVERINSSVSRQLSRRLFGSITTVLSQNRHMLGSENINLRGDAAFRLTNEGDRPAFSDANEISPAGVPAVRTGRRIPTLGAVNEYQSSLHGSAVQIGGELTLSPLRVGGPRVTVAYTWSKATQQTRGLFSTTGGDPHQIEAAPADFDIRHTVRLNAVLPTPSWFDVFTFGRASSGLPYTPTIATDINGDGLSNDRAFIFRPDGTDGAGASIQRVIANAPPNAHRCLLDQLGQIAGSNSCRAGWSYSIDLQAVVHPEYLSRSRRFSLAVRANNITGVIDRAIHGADGMRGWGYIAIPDPILLRPTGFNQVTRRYQYAVNPHFGRASPYMLVGTPFRISAELRVVVGNDPRRQLLLQELGRTRVNSAGRDTAQLARHVIDRLPDPFQIVLSRAPVLRLTHEQRARIEAMGASYRIEAAALWKPAVVYLASLPEAFDAPAAIDTLNAAFVAAQRAQLRWGREIRSVLTENQRDRLPRYLQHVMHDDEAVVEDLIK